MNVRLMKVLARKELEPYKSKEAKKLNEKNKGQEKGFLTLVGF